VNIELCNSKSKSVRNETERYNALSVKLFHRTSRKDDFVGLASTRMSGGRPEHYPLAANQIKIEHLRKHHTSGMLSYERRRNPDVEIVSDLTYLEGRTSLLMHSYQKLRSQSAEPK
jgi:hypothetical protein